MSTNPQGFTWATEDLPDTLHAEADLYSSYETEHAELIRFAARRVAALEAVAEAARAWRKVARPPVSVIKNSTFDEVEALSEACVPAGDALAAALDALDGDQ